LRRTVRLNGKRKGRRVKRKRSPETKNTFHSQWREREIASLRRSLHSLRETGVYFWKKRRNKNRPEKNPDTRWKTKGGGCCGPSGGFEGKKRAGRVRWIIKVTELENRNSEGEGQWKGRIRRRKKRRLKKKSTTRLKRWLDRFCAE